MKVAIPKEHPSEHRVALVPQVVRELTQLGCTILLEKNSGLKANYPDESYQQVTFYDDVSSLYQSADIIFKVQPLLENEVSYCKKNAIVIGLLSPSRYPERILAMRDNFITSFAMELIPRISRAQTMDALSSQATVAGYKAVLLAANLSNKLFPMLTTAAGTIRPTNVLVIGAGVAGLQAIATARRLGAIVKAYDIRPAAREQVESLGAKMVNVDLAAETTGGYARQLTVDEQQKQHAVLHEAIAKSEIVITTALIPGKSAPKIISRAMVESMLPGSVIVDIAAEAGGNCELTEVDRTINYHNVIIYGPVNLPSMVASDASNMYAKNLINFLKLLIKDGKLMLDWDDEIIAQSVLTHEGTIRHHPTRELIAGVKT